MKKHPSGGVSAVVTLFLITAVMAGLLAMVNAVTAGPIADGLREKTENSSPSGLTPLSGPANTWSSPDLIFSAASSMASCVPSTAIFSFSGDR